MMNSLKPRKRIVLYWFVEYGFFFIVASFLLLGIVLQNYSNYFSLTYFVLNSVWLVAILSFIYLIYKWFTTEYFVLKKHIFIKESEQTIIIPYTNIKKVGEYSNLLQRLFGITTVQVKTKNNKNYYIQGVSNHRKVEKMILKKM